jgi:hypothetical protein
VIPVDLAKRLRDAGLVWVPAPGDRFAVPDRGLDDQTFVLSDMTIQVYELTEGSVIGFNGTTEWALDDVDKDEAVWLPREDQLRDVLGAQFRRLERDGDSFKVVLDGDEFAADTAVAAYGEAVLAKLTPRR